MAFSLGLFIGLIGLALGSFANVVIIRLHEGSSLGGRSHCMRCRKVLRAIDLIPVFSWIALRGKCHFCKKAIHWQYPLVECVMTILAIVAYLRHIDDPSGYGWIAFEIAVGFVLLVIAVFDFRWSLVPVEFVCGSAVVLALWQIILGAPMSSVFLGAAVQGAFLGIIVLLSRGRMMGEGDPFVGLLTGSILGFASSFIGLLSTFTIGGGVAVVLLLQGAVGRKTQIPFVPFLVAGTLIAFWFGVDIQDFILNHPLF